MINFNVNPEKIIAILLHWRLTRKKKILAEQQLCWTEILFRECTPVRALRNGKSRLFFSMSSLQVYQLQQVLERCVVCVPVSHNSTISIFPYPLGEIDQEKYCPFFFIFFRQATILKLGRPIHSQSGGASSSTVRSLFFAFQTGDYGFRRDLVQKIVQRSDVVNNKRWKIKKPWRGHESRAEETRIRDQKPERQKATVIGRPGLLREHRMFSRTFRASRIGQASDGKYWKENEFLSVRAVLVAGKN